MNEIAEALGIPTGRSGTQSDEPYPLEVPIRVRGMAGSGNLGAESMCEPFLEDTLTVLVSPRGAVLRLAAQATPGQMLTISSPRLGREMTARVVRYRGHANVKGYAEIEFAPDVAIAERGTSAASPATDSPVPRLPEMHSQTCASVPSGGPSLVVAPLADLLEQPRAPRRGRTYEPLDPPLPRPQPRPASPRPSEARTNPRTKPAPQGKPPAMDIETLLAARKAAEQAVVEAQPPALEIAQRLLEPGALAAFSEPRRPRKRWLAIAAAALLTVGAAATWAVVATTPTLGPLPDIAAFALPEPPRGIGQRNEVRFFPTVKFETESLPIATQLFPPLAVTPVRPRSSESRQRDLAEAAVAPEIRSADPAPAGVAKQGALTALAPLVRAEAPKAPGPPIGGEVTPPRLLSQAPVVYPQMARLTRTEGSVVIDARIDQSGRVTDMRIVSGPAMFHQAAKESLAQWRYQPALLNGRPVTTHLYVTLQFRR